MPLRFWSILWHRDPKKETDRGFFIDPSAYFVFVDPVQLPNLIFDPFDIDSLPYMYHYVPYLLYRVIIHQYSYDSGPVAFAYAARLRPIRFDATQGTASESGDYTVQTCRARFGSGICR